MKTIAAAPAWRTHRQCCTGCPYVAGEMRHLYGMLRYGMRDEPLFPAVVAPSKKYFFRLRGLARRRGVDYGFHLQWNRHEVLWPP
jgi:hypothetical protein